MLLPYSGHYRHRNWTKDSPIYFFEGLSSLSLAFGSSLILNGEIPDGSWSDSSVLAFSFRLYCKRTPLVVDHYERPRRKVPLDDHRGRQYREFQ